MGSLAAEARRSMLFVDVTMRVPNHANLSPHTIAEIAIRLRLPNVYFTHIPQEFAYEPL